MDSPHFFTQDRLFSSLLTQFFFFNVAQLVHVTVEVTSTPALTCCAVSIVDPTGTAAEAGYVGITKVCPVRDYGFVFLHALPRNDASQFPYFCRPNRLHPLQVRNAPTKNDLK